MPGAPARTLLAVLTRLGYVLLAEIVVDVGIWGLNKGLTYVVPAKFEPMLSTGSVVRVPLRNRRVRGWVIGLSFFDPPPPDAEIPGKLQQVAAVSGRGPVFDEALLAMARDLSRHYVHPLSSFLSLFTPPRLGRPVAAGSRRIARGPAGTGTGQALIRLAPGEDAVERYGSEIEARLEQGKGAIVAVPEVREGSRLLEELARRFPEEAAVVHSGRDVQERSKDLWSVAEGRKRVVLGGRAAMYAPLFEEGLIIVHQEHDPSFKDQRSPYYDARDAARFRAARTGASLLLASSTPSLSSIATYAPGGLWKEPLRAAQREAWPVVETVHPPKMAVPRRAVAAIIEARARGAGALILLPRVQATRAGPGPAEVEQFIRRVVPEAVVKRADRPALGPQPGALAGALQADVVIATEAALAEVERPSLGLAIALGVDALLQRPSGRAVEDAFATLWALGSLVANRRPKGRYVLETSSTETPAIQALVRGDYAYFARWELQTRAAAAAPPFRKLVKLMMRDLPEDGLMEGLRALSGVDVLGPAPGGRLGFEILLKAKNMELILDPLARLVEDSAGRVLAEVEPRDW